MKLRTRVIGGLLCVFLITVILGIFSTIVINRIQAQSRELDILTALDQSVNEVIADVLVWRYELVSAIIFEQDFTNSLHVDHSAFGLWFNSPNSAWIQNDPEIDRLISALDESNRQMHEATLRLIRNQRSGVINIIFLTQELENIVLPLASETVNNLQALSERYLELVQVQADNVWHFQNDMVMITLLVCVIGLLAFVILSYFITRSIIRPVTNIRDVVSEIISGNFNINRTKHAKDEIGALTEHVYALVDTVKGITVDLTDFNKEYAVNGNTDYKISTEGYHGGYLDIVNGINQLADTAVDDMNAAINVIESIGNGNFDMSVKKMPGKKIRLNHAIDEIAKSMKEIHAEIKFLFDSIANGVLDARADVGKYKGVWALLLSDMNDMLSTSLNPITEVETVLGEMAKGEFKTPVSGDYKGVFGNLKQAVNSTGEQLLINVNDITGALEKVAAGDLTVPIDRRYIESYKPIKEALIGIVKALNASLRAVNDVSEQVQSNANNMSLSATELAEGSSRQAGAVQDLNASLEMVNEKTQLNVQTALAANERAKQSTESARGGSQNMQSMLDSMESIKTASENISSILSVIQSISFQTNLLALNASVEAARAGEHGKGFAVVAEEVRNLATRSQEATKNTENELAASEEMVDKGMSMANSTSDSLKAIVEHVKEVSSLISQMSNMSQDQAEAINQVYQGVREISDVVQANSTTSEELAVTSKELNSQTENMQRAISVFKLREPREAYKKEGKF